MSVETETEKVAAYSWLRPFQEARDGIEVKCPKCKSIDLHWDWHDTILIGGHCQNVFENAKLVAPEGVDLNPETEHLCRGCIACGYAWCEKTADASR
ncbi:hypothetical protein ACFZAM_31445 [Streptomyces sp. NPDC008079]|uniref:hypothetical protein n=1 Tax=Streptomyces sp. NPDC008079 TaxID=3364806 RepID=UPI0036ED43D1